MLGKCEMPDALVVNASPLIFLGNAGHIDLLRLAGASRVIVSQTVFDEVTATMHDDAAVRSVIASTWLERVAPVEIPDSVIEWDLGPGESSVIALALVRRPLRPRRGSYPTR